MQIVAALVWPALALVFAAIFTGLWRADSARMHLLGFATGFFALFLAMSVHLAVPSLNPVMSVPPLHVLACLSVVAIIWGAAKRLGHKIPLVVMLALIAVSSVVLFFALGSGDHEVVLLVQNGTSGLLFAIGAVVLWTARSTDVLDRILIATISLIAAMGLIRPIVFLFMRIEVAPLIERQQDVNAVSFVLLTLLTAILGGTLIAIAVKEALEIRLKAARIDPISGFLDPPTFDQTCAPILMNAHRLEMPVSLAVLEFDRFEMLQNKWGQDTIERVIREICDVIRSWQRESDIIGRIGEHQLGILFVGVGASSAQSIIQKLRNDVDREFNEALGGDLKFTLSASIVQSKRGTDFNALLCAAMQPFGTHQQLGRAATFINGVEAQLTPLRRSGDEAFVNHG